MSSGSIEHDVAGDVCLHRLGHEHARALLLIEAILMAQIAMHLRPARLVAIAAVHARPRWHEWIVGLCVAPQSYGRVANLRELRVHDGGSAVVARQVDPVASKEPGYN